MSCVMDEGLEGAPPRISVVMPVFNAEGTVSQSLRSALAQTFSALEVVVVDDGSRDASVAVVEGLARNDSRVRLLRRRNQGAATARNTALAAARGELVAFLDADDTWAPACLEKLAGALEARPDAALAYCGWQNLGVSGGRGAPFVPPDYETPDKLETLLGGCRWPIHACLTRKRSIDRVGGFNPARTASMDYDLWLRIAPFEPVVRVPEVLAFYHHHEAQGRITSDRGRLALNHLRAQRDFLSARPEAARRIRWRRRRELLYGELLRRGFDAYWKRDLPAARRIFRHVMLHGYGRGREWKYMLPSLLPASVHDRLIRTFEAGPAAADR